VWTAKTENENADVTTNYVVSSIAGIAGAVIEAYAQDSKKSSKSLEEEYIELSIEE